MPAVQSRATERGWRDRVESMARRLGFQQGMSTEQVRQAALAALGATGQNIAIGRSEVLEIEPALEALYEVEVAAPSPSSSSETPNSESSS